MFLEHRGSGHRCKMRKWQRKFLQSQAGREARPTRSRASQPCPAVCFLGCSLERLVVAYGIELRAPESAQTAIFTW